MSDRHTEHWRSGWWILPAAVAGVALIAGAIVAGVAHADGAMAEDPCARRYDFSERAQGMDPFLSAEQAAQMEVVQVAWEAAHCGAPVPATFASFLIVRDGELAGVTDAELLDLAWGHQPRDRHGFQLGGGEQEAPSPVPLPGAGPMLLVGLGGLAGFRRWGVV